MAWLAGYSKRKKITLTGGASGAQTAFQLKLTVTYDGDMQSDFDDLRFTQSDGQTLIDAWLETKTDDTSAIVWAEFPTTPANTVEQTYYMYYGKAAAVNYWDIRATMLDGDDFTGAALDTNIWDKQYCDAAVGSGKLTLNNFLATGGRYDGGILGKRLVGASSVTEVYLKNTNAADGGQFGLSKTHSFYADDSCGIYQMYTQVEDIVQYNNGSGSFGSDVAFSANTYYRFEIKHDGTDVHYYRDTVEITSSPLGTNVPNEQMYMLISGDANHSPTFEVDWIFTRKYASGPPTYAFGSEESEAIELSAIIATVTAVSASDLNILRPLASTIATVTLLSEIELLTGEIRELVATIAASTSTSTSDLNILRELIATIDATTSLSDIELIVSVLRELVASIATGTTVSAADVKVLRELVTSIATATSTSSILIGFILELVSTIAATTSILDAEVDVVRALDTTIATTTATTADIKVLRELSATIAVQSALSDIELLIVSLRELVATIAATTSTSAVGVDVLRELIATIDTQTGSVATTGVLRELIASIDTTTSLSDIELLTGVLRELSAIIAVATSTSASDLNVVRGMDATIASTTSMSDADLSVLRELASTVAVVTLTSTIDLLVETLRELSATIATVTSTSTPEMKVLRELEAIIEATTALSAIELTFSMWLTSNPTITRLKSEGWFE